MSRRPAANVTYIDFDTEESNQDENEYVEKILQETKTKKGDDNKEDGNDVEAYEPDEEALAPISEESEAEEESFHDDDDDDDVVCTKSDDDFDGDEATPPPVKRKAAPKKEKKEKSEKSEKPKAKKAKTATKTATKTKAKTSTITTTNPNEAKAIVQAYILKMNRPFSAINVYDNLHRSIAKPGIIKALDTCVEEGSVLAKAYGKNKIYFANQVHLPALSEEEIVVITNEITILEEESNELKVAVKRVGGKLSALTSALSDDVLATRLEEMNEQEKELDKALGERKDDPEPMDPEVKGKMEENLARYQNAWKLRKKIVLNSVGTIAEGMEKKSSDIFELVGLETE